MDRNYKHYDEGFKRYVAKLVVDDGRRMADIERELGISYPSLQRWVNAYRQEEDEKKKASQEELLTASEYKAKLEASEAARKAAEEENDILKKAMHIFTEDPRK